LSFEKLARSVEAGDLAAVPRSVLAMQRSLSNYRTYFAGCMQLMHALRLGKGN
jgi:hypothetical protein